MNNTDIRSQYGLKYNPFLPDVPAEALFTIPGTEQFVMRVQAMAAEGGFALRARGRRARGRGGLGDGHN